MWAGPRRRLIWSGRLVWDAGGSAMAADLVWAGGRGCGVVRDGGWSGVWGAGCGGLVLAAGCLVWAAGLGCGWPGLGGWSGMRAGPRRRLIWDAGWSGLQRRVVCDAGCSATGVAWDAATRIDSDREGKHGHDQ